MRSRRREVKERVDALAQYDIVRPSPQAVASRTQKSSDSVSRIPFTLFTQPYLQFNGENLHFTICNYITSGFVSRYSISE